MKFIKILAISALVTFSLSNCSQAPKSDEAKTGDAKKVDDKKAAEGSDFAVDTKKSEIT
jgi:hypothetical protein